MSNVYDESPVSGVGPYELTFQYQKQENVVVLYYNPSTTEYTVQSNTEWSFVNETQIQLNAVPSAEFSQVRRQRVTDIDQLRAIFYPGSAIRAQDLNANFEQLQFKVQELNSGVGEIAVDIDDIKDDISDINDIITELSGIVILANVAALNSYDPIEGSEGSAIQVSNSTDWSSALNVTGTPAGFVGGSDLRVNLRITNDETPTYAFISYSPVDPDNRYVNKAGDTMTGPLVLPGDPTADLQASSKKYVDDKFAGEANTTYDFGSATNGTNAQLQLVGSDGTTDSVTITPGSNITITGQSSTGFTINAAGSAIPGTGNVTIVAGTNMTGGGSFNVNQSSDVTITLDATGSGTGSTNLSWANQTATTGDVTSDTGTNATLTAATTSLAGLMSASDKVALGNAASTSDLSNYLTISNAASTYQTIAGMSSYYTKTESDNKYLVKDFATLDLLP